MDNESVTVKTCVTCKGEFALSAFYSDKRNSDGATSECRECIRARRKADRAKERAREKAAGYERQKRWQAAHPETRRAVQAAYRERKRKRGTT